MVVVQKDVNRCACVPTRMYLVVVTNTLLQIGTTGGGQSRPSLRQPIFILPYTLGHDMLGFSLAILIAQCRS